MSIGANFSIMKSGGFVNTRRTPAVPLKPQAISSAQRLADKLWGENRPRPEPVSEDRIDKSYDDKVARQMGLGKTKRR